MVAAVRHAVLASSVIAPCVPPIERVDRGTAPSAPATRRGRGRGQRMSDPQGADRKAWLVGECDANATASSTQHMPTVRRQPMPALKERLLSLSAGYLAVQWILGGTRARIVHLKRSLYGHRR